MEDAIQRLIDIEEIQQLKARYFRFMDTRQWDALRSVLTDDMRFDSGTGKVMTDPDAFVSFLAGIGEESVVVHHGMHPEITITGPDSATGVWTLSVYVRPRAGGAGVRCFGLYDDRYARTSDGWRVQSAVITMLGREDLPASV